MVEQRTTAAAVDGQLARYFNSSLVDEYWRWVKNQLMLEDGINFYPDDPIGPSLPPLGEPPCRIQPKAVQHDETTMVVRLDHTLEYPNQRTVAVSLLPLQSNVVEITFTAGTTTSVDIKARAISSTGTGLKYKVYLDQPMDVDNAACRNVTDGFRVITEPLPAGAKAYVLVSNTLFEGNSPTAYVVSVSTLED